MILLKSPLQVQPAGTAVLNDRFGCIGAITPYQPGLRAVTGGAEISVEWGSGGLGFVTGASTGSARVAFVGGEDIAGLSQASVLVYRVVGTVAGAVPAMAETTTGFWRFGFQANGTQFRTRDTSTGDTGGGEDLTMSAGTAGALEVRIGTYNAVAGRKRGYINGKLNASTTTSVNAFTTTKSAHIGLGTQDTAVNRSNTAPIFLVAFASREWSESEVAALSANPWQLFQPRRIWVPVSVAGGGTTVSVPAGSLTLTAYAPTVSNPLSIPIPAAALTLSGFAPTVTTPRIVSVPAGSLTLTGFAPVVGTPRTISVPAGSLSLTAFAPTVSVATAGTTVSVPAGSLSLTGFAPTVSISAVIAIPPGALTLTGFAPSVFVTAGTIVDVPAGGLTLSGFAPTVYTVGDFTTSFFYLPLRAYADGMSGTVDPTTALDNLRSLLPSQRTPLVNADSTMSSQWYRFFDYMVNQYLGGLTQPTVADIVASVEATQASVNASAGATALIAQQAQANAESLAAVVQVTQNASIPGASQIPPVSLSYLEP